MKYLPVRVLLSLTLASLLSASCGGDSVPQPQQDASLLIYTFLEQYEFDKIELLVDGILQGTLTERVDDSLPCTTETSAFAVKIRLMAGKKYDFEAKRYKDGSEVGSWEKENTQLDPNTCQRLALQ